MISGINSYNMAMCASSNGMVLNHEWQAVGARPPLFQWPSLEENMFLPARGRCSSREENTARLDASVLVSGL